MSAENQQQRRVRVYVEGRVQGVWFRETARRVAEQCRVRGWIRNLPDGRVEAVYEGEPASVAALLDWTRRGPRKAIVTRVEIREEKPRGETGFVVRD